MLVKIDLPAGLTEVASSLFWGSTALQHVSLPDSISAIGQYAFRDCSALTIIRIPPNVTSIGAGRGETFAGCERLKGVYFEGNRPVHGSRIFHESLDVVVYRLPDATGWTSSDYADRPVQLWLPQTALIPRESSSGSTLDVQASWANGRDIVLETRDHLVHGAWVPIDTNTTVEGQTLFSIPLPPDQATGFFRCVP